MILRLGVRRDAAFLFTEMFPLETFNYYINSPTALKSPCGKTAQTSSETT
jgi:hypothetical protein